MLAHEETPALVIRLSEPGVYGGLSLIGKAVVLKTTSSRVKAACRFESGGLHQSSKSGSLSARYKVILAP